MTLDANGACSRTASAVGGAERLVQIEVHDVVSHVTRPGYPHERVQIGAVHIHETPGLMHEFADLGDIGLEHSERIGIGQHHSRNVFVQCRAQGSHVGTSRLVGLERLGLETSQRDRSRIGPMGGVRNQNPGSLRLAVGVVIGPHQQNAGHLSLSPSRRLQGDVVHPGDFTQNLR